MTYHKLRQFCKQDPPLQKHGEEGLLLLRHAWNEYDVAMYHGHHYSLISWILTFSYLALGFFTVLFIVILTAYCGDNAVGDNASADGDNDRCYLPGLSERQMERWIFLLSLAVTFIVSVDECIKPAQKAMHLKPAAEKLKSWIWHYR